MDNQPKIKFLEESLHAMYEVRSSKDRKASFLLGTSGVIFVLTLNNYQDTAFFLLAIFSALSLALCIYCIALPARSLSREAKPSIFCWWGIKKYSYEDYVKKIDLTIKDEESLGREYAKEIFSLYKNSIRIKSVLLNLASISLLVGFTAVVFTLLFTNLGIF